MSTSWPCAFLEAGIADFASKADLANKLRQCIAEWNERAHPFNWSTKSVAKVMADAPFKKAA
jgi:hypothetical protein